ncbi:MAG: Gfo/Idh/MocA family oxidoreductase [Nostocaceae cyanobacterium]|nr:Gfo/Idh/MocA family oxidoreductase [Nostocaceae cyanobacterium]
MTNIAVIGIGRWGVHLLRNFLAHPLFNVVAICDPNLQQLTAVKQQFQLDKKVVLATNYQSVYELPELQAVAIATPATTHYPLITKALKQGYHVLAEKPLTLDPKECHELCQLAEQQGLILMVDHTYLFHPAVERAQSVIQGGQLGDLRYGYSTRTNLGPVRQDVDALWDLAIHDIAIFNRWLGHKPMQVQANGRMWLHTEGELADLVWVTLTYPDGFQAFIHLCWLNPDKQRRIGVVGSLGSLIFDEMSKAPLTLVHGELEQIDSQYIPVNQKPEVLKIETTEPLQRVCDSFAAALRADRFADCIHNNRPPEISSGWVGTELVEILTALSASLKDGGTPKAVESPES